MSEKNLLLPGIVIDILVPSLSFPPVSKIWYRIAIPRRRYIHPLVHISSIFHVFKEHNQRSKGTQSQIPRAPKTAGSMTDSRQSFEFCAALSWVDFLQIGVAYLRSGGVIIMNISSLSHIPSCTKAPAKRKGQPHRCEGGTNEIHTA